MSKAKRYEFKYYTSPHTGNPGFYWGPDEGPGHYWDPFQDVFLCEEELLDLGFIQSDTKSFAVLVRKTSGQDYRKFVLDREFREVSIGRESFSLALGIASFFGGLEGYFKITDVKVGRTPPPLEERLARLDGMTIDGLTFKDGRVILGLQDGCSISVPLKDLTLIEES